MSYTDDLWSGHCKQARAVHFFGTEIEVDAWLTYKRADTLIKKMDGINTIPFLWEKRAPGAFTYIDYGTEDEEDEVSGVKAYLDHQGDTFPTFAYHEGLAQVLGDPITWFEGDT